MENLNPHDMRCLDWSVQNYDKVHWLPHPSAAVFPHQNDVKVQNCKRRLSDEHQYSNCKCQTRLFSSASYGKSQWAALDQRLLRASSETLARYCASDSINSSSTQDQRKGLHWATWPDQSKGTQHHITLSPQFAQDWDSETSTIRTKRIIKNGQERSKRKANHMTLTQALASACFPPLPSQKHLSCSTSAPGQAWTVSSQNLLDSEVATRLLATHATHTSPSAMPNKWLKSHTFQPQKQRCPHLNCSMCKSGMSGRKSHERRNTLHIMLYDYILHILGSRILGQRSRQSPFLRWQWCQAPREFKFEVCSDANMANCLKEKTCDICIPYMNQTSLKRSGGVAVQLG